MISTLHLQQFLTVYIISFRHGAQSLSVSRLVPCIVKLLGDPMAAVRDTALNTLVEVYRHVGDRLRVDLQKKHNVPASKWVWLNSNN
jgi:CLIP-associating protein 1/2